MAARRQLSEGTRRLRRWLYTTPHALDAVRLSVAAAIGGVSLVAFAAFFEVGTRAVFVAALPAASQVIKQVRTARRRRSDDKRRLSMGSLEGADLTGVELPDIYLRKKDLTEARLVEANLVRADLTGAVLGGTRLGRANLSYGRLTDARCHDTNFYRARLVELDLRGVDARDASFEEADLRHADLRNADLLGARFRGADVRGADFTGAKLAPDALIDATVDGTTILQTGRAAARIEVPPFTRWRTGLDSAVHRVTWTAVRPLVWGMGLALAVGAAVVVDVTGGGLADQVNEAFGTDPVTTPKPSTGTGSGSGSGERRPENTDPPAIPDLPEVPALLPVDPGIDDSVGSATGSAADGQPTGTEIGEGPIEVDVDPSPAAVTDAALEADPPATAVTGPSSDTDGLTADPATTPVDVPDPTEFILGAAHRIELVLSAEGGTATVMTTSVLGRSDPVAIAGDEGWQLSLAGGSLAVEVVPDDETTVTSCRILVDGVEMSFHGGYPGHRTACIVDLGPTG